MHTYKRDSCVANKVSIISNTVSFRISFFLGAIMQFQVIFSSWWACLVYHHAKCNVFCKAWLCLEKRKWKLVLLHHTRLVPEKGLVTQERCQILISWFLPNYLKTGFIGFLTSKLWQGQLKSIRERLVGRALQDFLHTWDVVKVWRLLFTVWSRYHGSIHHQ